MKGANVRILAVAAAIVSGVFLAACGGGEKAAAPSPSPTVAPALTAVAPVLTPAQALLPTPAVIPTSVPAPTREVQRASTAQSPTGPSGRLVIGMASFPSAALNPLVPPASAAGQLLRPIFDDLVGTDPSGGLAPGIATSWTLDPDGLSWTFQIRQGVKFHNGDVLTPEDVRFSLLAFSGKWQGAPQPTTSFWSSLGIEDVEVISSGAVRVRTTGLQVYLPYKVSAVGGGHEGFVLPKGYVEKEGWNKLGSKPVGSGPWTFVQQTPGVNITYEAVSAHWRKVPYFKELTLVVLPEESTRVASLSVGQTDIVEIGPESVERVGRIGRIASIPDSTMAVLPIYGSDYDVLATKAAGNVRVRQALFSAIDRQEIVEVLLRGLGKAGTLPAPVWEFSADVDVNVLPKLEFSPAQAKLILAEAGFPTFSIDIISSAPPALPYAPRIVEAVAGYWARIGVQPRIVPMEYGTLTATQRQVPTVMQFRGTAALLGFPAQPILQTNLQAMYAPRSSMHLLQSPEIENLAKASQGEPDQAKRKEVLTRAITVAHNSFVATQLFTAPVLFGFGNGVKDWQPIRGHARLGAVFETVGRAR
ncbi:MAG: hypothetical protein HYX90_07540 [Chloroflexi bacterium]|nr:hypothetical protein [Chloroflexota bacterium]